ncbi:MAG: PilZ domain-containing protein [Endomicrobiales bacterium]|nr:PilZ domain-containing protein [Endomicrobiales bacterium]
MEVFSCDNMENICSGFIKDIGEDGLAFEVPRKLRLNGEFALKFTLPNGWYFNILSEVRYIKDGVLTISHGARFSKINNWQRENIKKYIENNYQKEVGI